jgi:hypothetical protein
MALGFQATTMDTDAACWESVGEAELLLGSCTGATSFPLRFQATFGELG